MVAAFVTGDAQFVKLVVNFLTAFFSTCLIYGTVKVRSVFSSHNFLSARCSRRRALQLFCMRWVIPLGNEERLWNQLIKVATCGVFMQWYLEWEIVVFDSVGHCSVTTKTFALQPCVIIYHTDVKTGKWWQLCFIPHICCIIVSTMEWTWWDWSLILRTYLPSVFWHCWLDHLTHENASPIWPTTCLVGR